MAKCDVCRQEADKLRALARQHSRPRQPTELPPEIVDAIFANIARIRAEMEAERRARLPGRVMRLLRD